MGCAHIGCLLTLLDRSGCRDIDQVAEIVQRLMPLVQLAVPASFPPAASAEGGSTGAVLSEEVRRIHLGQWASFTRIKLTDK